MLKTSKQVVLILFALLTTAVFATPDTFQEHTEVKSAFTKGDAELLREVMSSSVEIELPSEMEGIYSKAQTIIILNKFFKDNPPKSFVLSHSGQSASSSKFVVGTYNSKAGKEFRVTLFMKKSGKQYFIQEIELEEE